MEREGKGRERKGKKHEEFMGIKLKRGRVLVSKRGGVSTPSPAWRIGCAQPDGSLLQDLTLPIKNTSIAAALSARKLGANIWEVETHFKMSKHKHHKDKGLIKLPTQLDEPPDNPTEEPARTSSLGREIAASLVQHHRSIERNGRALQPVSPASYSSSLEVTPYFGHGAVTPASSLDFRERGELSYNLKTSTELLKVLNRIWSLEEQHASNSSLAKVLKREVDYLRARIKDLLQEKKNDRQEIDDLRRRTAETKPGGSSKEQDRIKDAVQLMRDELEGERKLRKHSESLHRKLARELTEVKSSFSNALKELERERKARVLLENLCDEFAKGIRDYEKEVRLLKQNPDKDWVIRENPDRLILHISEAWLDERMQMKLDQARCDPGEKNTIVDKLSFEIETFLQAKQSAGSSKKLRGSSLHRHSLESFHLNEAVSAPQNADYDEESLGSPSNSFELNRASSGKQKNSSSKHEEKNAKLNPMRKKIQSREVIKQFEEHLSRTVLSNGNRTKLLDGKPRIERVENLDEVDNRQKSEITEVSQAGSHEIEKKRAATQESNSVHLLDSLTRNRSLSRKGGKLHLENKLIEDSLEQATLSSNPSILRQWISRTAGRDSELSEPSRSASGSIKENSLKAKLLEAKFESQQSRMRTSKTPYG